MYYDPSYNNEQYRQGFYWSSTSFGESGGYFMEFGQSDLGFDYSSNLGYIGKSVRLVRVAN